MLKSINFENVIKFSGLCTKNQSAEQYESLIPWIFGKHKNLKNHGIRSSDRFFRWNKKSQKKSYATIYVSSVCITKLEYSFSLPPSPLKGYEKNLQYRAWIFGQVLLNSD